MRNLTLPIICVIVSCLLALTNMVTSPIIEENKLKKEMEIIESIIGEVGEYSLVETNSKDVYKHYSFEQTDILMVNTKGYNGNVEVICAFNKNKEIIRVDILKHAETKGIGSKVTSPDFLNQFTNNEFIPISGATISSKAINNAVTTARNYIEGVN